MQTLLLGNSTNSLTHSRTLKYVELFKIVGDLRSSFDQTVTIIEAT